LLISQGGESYCTERRRSIHQRCRPIQVIDPVISEQSINPICSRSQHVYPSGTRGFPNSPGILLPHNAATITRLLSSLASFYHQPIQLKELADHCLSLQPRTCQQIVPSIPLLLFSPLHRLRTFNTCNSFNPCCVNSCILRASLSVLCSRNASLVLRLAYSLKLYAANCLDWRRSERYSDRTSRAVVLAIPLDVCGE
jgi:hypothetical protein